VGGGSDSLKIQTYVFVKCQNTSDKIKRSGSITGHMDERLTSRKESKK